VELERECPIHAGLDERTWKYKCNNISKFTRMFDERFGKRTLSSEWRVSKYYTLPVACRCPGKEVSLKNFRRFGVNIYTDAMKFWRDGVKECP
jgi:hypothetical protein